MYSAAVSGSVSRLTAMLFAGLTATDVVVGGTGGAVVGGVAGKSSLYMATIFIIWVLNGLLHVRSTLRFVLSRAIT